MSHSPPQIPTPNLHRRGNDASGYGQAPPNLRQAFMKTDSQQKSSGRSNSSSGSRSSGGRASEQAVTEHGRPRQLTILLPTPERSPERRPLQNPSDLARPSPVGATTALENPFTKPVFNLSHPACLIPGYRAPTQDAEQTRHIAEEKSSHLRDLFITSARIPSASPPLEPASRQPFQQAIPLGSNTNNSFVDFSSAPQTPTATAEDIPQRRRAPQAPPQRSRWGPAGSDYVIVFPAQGTRCPAEARRIPATRYTNDATQDGRLFVFTAEEEAALRGDVRLRGEGYRLRDARYHPDFIREGSPAGAQPLVANGIEAADILRRFEWGVRRSGEIRLQTHSHRFESNRGSASISPTDAKPCLSPTCTSFRSPFPPPRPSVDVIARNPFIAASRFDFEIKNVDREDIISDEVAALDYSFDNDGDNNDHDDDDGEIEAGTEAGARRASSLMREWKLWSQGWREELAVRMGFQWKVSFEEGADDRDGEGEE